MKNKLIVRGLIKVVKEYEYGDGVYVGDKPLSEQVQEINNKNVTVRFFISETEKTLDELKENLILTLSGAVYADYCNHYSEFTGHLWTDDELKIGYHSLLDDIEDHEGKFATIIIDINQVE